MATRNVLTQSCIIQSLGAGLGLLVVVIVAQRFGPSAQGDFATARAWVDMASLVLLAGLPQALIHEVSSGRLNGQVAARLALAFAASGSVALWAGTSLLTALNPPFLDVHVRAMLVSAACLATIYGLLRVLVLTSRRYLGYNLLSAAPSGLLVVGMLLIPIADPTRLALVLVVVFAACALMAIVAVRDLLFSPTAERTTPTKVSRLVRYGAWSFVQQAAAQGAILGSYLLLRASGSDIVGYFSVAMVMVSVVTLPLNIVGPILLSRWIEEYAVSRRTNHFEQATCGFFLFSVLATVTGLPVIYVAVPFVFGVEFAPALTACLAIVASTVLLIQRRVLSTAGLAFGMPRYCAISEASRAIVTLVVLASQPTLGGAIAGWCAGEIVGLLMIAVALKRRLGLAYRQVLGVDRAAAADLMRHVFRRQHDL